LEFRRNLSAVGVEGIFLIFPRAEASEIPFSTAHHHIITKPGIKKMALLMQAF
jgi:hypothetical protein